MLSHSTSPGREDDLELIFQVKGHLDEFQQASRAVWKICQSFPAQLYLLLHKPLFSPQRQHRWKDCAFHLYRNPAVLYLAAHSGWEYIITSIYPLHVPLLSLTSIFSCQHEIPVTHSPALCASFPSTAFQFVSLPWFLFVYFSEEVPYIQICIILFYLILAFLFHCPIPLMTQASGSIGFSPGTWDDSLIHTCHIQGASKGQSKKNIMQSASRFWIICWVITSVWLLEGHSKYAEGQKRGNRSMNFEVSANHS